jgi:hypothetical protein
VIILYHAPVDSWLFVSSLLKGKTKGKPYNEYDFTINGYDRMCYVKFEHSFYVLSHSVIGSIFCSYILEHSLLGYYKM